MSEIRSYSMVTMFWTAMSDQTYPTYMDVFECITPDDVTANFQAIIRNLITDLLKHRKYQPGRFLKQSSDTKKGWQSFEACPVISGSNASAHLFLRHIAGEIATPNGSVRTP